MNDDFVGFGRFLIGPHPVTREPNCWLYFRTAPPTPLSPEENERAEKIAADVFNMPLAERRT